MVFISQFVEHYSASIEVMDWNPVKPCRIVSYLICNCTFCPKQSNKIEGFVLNRVYPGIQGMGTSDCPLPYRKVLIKN